MIVTLIPFLLAARFEPPNAMLWKNDTEVTYLIQNDATILHSGDSDCFNMSFHLNTMFSCKNLNSSLYCYFHDTCVDSTPAVGKQKKRRKHVIEDMWTMQMLQQEIVQITYEKNGQASISAPVEPVGQLMMKSLARLLVVGVDLSTGRIGNFETASNITRGDCRTKFFVTRSVPPVNHKSSIMNIFLIPRPDESLARSLEIEQYVQDNDCVNKFSWYSFWTARELRKLDPINIEAQLISAENFIAIEDQNFTSFSTINTAIKNLKDNSEYSIEESISLSLQKIHIPKCLLCDDDDSSSHEDYSPEGRNIFTG